MFHYLNIPTQVAYQQPQSFFPPPLDKQSLVHPKISENVDRNSLVIPISQCVSSSTNGQRSYVTKKSVSFVSGSKRESSSDVDTSTYSIEERLISAVWVHERNRTKLTIGQIKRDFRNRFDKDPPTKNTLFMWEKKLFETGSIKDAKRSGRPCKRKSLVETVEASIKDSPSMSLRARSIALAVPKTTLRKIMCEDLKVDQRSQKKKKGSSIIVKQKPTLENKKKIRACKIKKKASDLNPTTRDDKKAYFAEPDKTMVQCHQISDSNMCRYGDTTTPMQQYSCYNYNSGDKNLHIQVPYQHYVVRNIQHM